MERLFGESGQKGFTLIELLVFIAILAVLAAVAIPAYSRFFRSGEAEANAARHWDCEYVWASHSAAALRAGARPEAVEIIAKGSSRVARLRFGSGSPLGPGYRRLSEQKRSVYLPGILKEGAAFGPQGLRASGRVSAD